MIQVFQPNISLKDKISVLKSLSMNQISGTSPVIKEFEEWVENRKFAPTIRALKSKLTSFKNLELENLKKKQNDFNFEHAELISDNIIQKITNHFANHLINENIAANKSEELIKKVFNLEKTL